MISYFSSRLSWFVLPFLFSFGACNGGTQVDEIALDSFVLWTPDPVEIIPDRPRVESRALITKNLEEKLSAGKPLFVRVFVPLCDNTYQGIIPVPKAIGNGQDPQSNLYWGAMYGVRTVFSQAEGWKSESLEFPIADSILLDRIIFRKQLPNGSELIVLAEAYDGRQIRRCVDDFFDAARGFGTVYGELNIPGCDLSNPDLVVFNGHNEIIKADIMQNKVSSDRPRDVAAIACLTDESFTVQLEQMNAYPILMTRSQMAPEAYVLKALVENWTDGETGPKIHSAVASSYNTYQKCGERGARGVFATGWELHDERDYWWW